MNFDEPWPSEAHSWRSPWPWPCPRSRPQAAAADAAPKAPEQGAILKAIL